MVLDRIKNMLATCSAQDKSQNVFPPTTLYSEGWMLNIILDWFSNAGSKVNSKQALRFPNKGRWYSEAILQTQFKALPKEKLYGKTKDDLAEKHTHADGVIGDFTIGGTGKGDLRLLENPKHFVVIEAKMFSPLSKGTKYAPDYDQAARTIACMANTLSLAPPHNALEFEHIGFYLLVPKKVKEDSDNEIHTLMNIKNIRTIIEARVEGYKKGYEKGVYTDKLNWFKNHLLPMVDKIERDNSIGILTWDDIIDYIEIDDKVAAKEIREFYKKCCEYNKR